ncbi:Protein-glutamate methylesterase/protein-glutamine glutaminase [subsurface metagenome]
MDNKQLEKGKRIKVLVVDDSAMVREVVAKILSTDKKIEIIGQARNGKEAIELVAQLKPDIVTMDIVMPEMDGLEATEYIMAYHPTPIAIVTSSLAGKGKDFVYKSLDLGALAVIAKPDHISDLGENFIEKIKLLSKVPVITHLTGKRKRRVKRTGISANKKVDTNKTVGIVSSTGGPDALRRILSKLPSDFPAGVVIVQHIGKGFEKDLIGWLNGYSRVTVKQAQPDEKIEPGCVYFAPSGYHTVVKEKGELGLINSPPVWGHRPSGDIMLSSLAQSYGLRAIGVILTGMGKDGARGLKAIKDAGGKTIAQDEKTSLIFGMPNVAIEMGAADRIVSIDSITDEIMKAL